MFDVFLLFSSRYFILITGAKINISRRLVVLAARLLAAGVWVVN